MIEVDVGVDWEDMVKSASGPIWRCDDASEGPDLFPNKYGK